MPPLDGDPGVFWALRDVSFEVEHGGVIGLIGRNGAGKSTLLKILSRITDPSEGSVEIHGRVASLLEVGTGFHPELTGRENVYLSGAICGMRRAETDRHFDEIVAFAEVEKFIDSPVKYYSSGMHVRLGFAVAAHLTSEIMLVDEVLAVGDIAFQKKCLGKISDVSQMGRTIVLVSHRMDSVRSLCQMAYWIDGGRLRAAGPANEITQLYEQDMLVMARDGTQSLNAVSKEHGIEVSTVTPCLSARRGSGPAHRDPREGVAAHRAHGHRDRNQDAGRRGRFPDQLEPVRLGAGEPGGRVAGTLHGPEHYSPPVER